MDLEYFKKKIPKQSDSLFIVFLFFALDLITVPWMLAKSSEIQKISNKEKYYKKLACSYFCKHFLITSVCFIYEN